jgi:hypothetical protein
MSFSGLHRTTFNWHFDKTVQETAEAASYTVGFASGPGGAFRAAWVDNRTGNWQIWTASINVLGTVLRNGSPELAGFVDVSSNAPVHIGNSYWDWSTGEFECDLFVKNTSAEPIRGPLEMRLLRFDSAVGIFNEAKINGKVMKPGSVVDVSSGGLKPGAWSRPLHLVANVTVLFGPDGQDAEERLLRLFTIESKRFASLTSKH